jgi:hypothetical protein
MLSVPDTPTENTDDCVFCGRETLGPDSCYPLSGYTGTPEIVPVVPRGEDDSRSSDNVAHCLHL